MPRENKSIKILCRGRYITFLKERKWEYVRRNNCTGIVIILAKTDDDRILFVEQYRPPVKCKVIEFPAGLVNDQRSKSVESFVRAAKRELLEETGYRAKTMTKIIQGPVSSGFTSDQVTFFLAGGLKKVGLGGGDGTENIKVHEIKTGQVDRWLQSKIKEGYLLDPKIYAGLYFFSQYN